MTDVIIVLAAFVAPLLLWLAVEEIGGTDQEGRAAYRRCTAPGCRMVNGHTGTHR
jgi:hypothetical protein